MSIAYNSTMQLPPEFVSNLPMFSDVPVSEKPQLFLKKLKLCSVRFDFSPTSGFDQQKEVKRQTLLDLVEYVNAAKGPFSETVIAEFTKMIAANIFRPLPTRSRDQPFDPEEDEPILESAWTHLHIVYEFFLRFMVSTCTDAKVAKKFINTEFITKFLELFDSEDPRERDYLKTILHRIYGKLMVHRSFVRKSIANVFYRFIYETERHNGVAELLEILGSIINGFALPLKDEHKQFLKRALVPLHKPGCIGQYHQQLSYCISQYMEKDPTLADIIIKGILKFWPVTNSQKEILFLSELEELLELTQPQQFEVVAVPLFQVVARCIRSPHFQVAERALFLWNNEYIVQQMSKSLSDIIPLVYGPLHQNTVGHWNPTVLSLSQNVQKMFREIDSVAWDTYSSEYQALVDKSAAAKAKRDQVWARLQSAA